MLKLINYKENIYTIFLNKNKNNYDIEKPNLALNAWINFSFIIFLDSYAGNFNKLTHVELVGNLISLFSKFTLWIVNYNYNIILSD